MAIRSAEAVWSGNLKQGTGSLKLGSGAFEGPYDFSSRFEQGRNTNPEELIGAAHAGCFAMYLSSLLEQSGYTAKRIHATAEVFLEMVANAPRITRIQLDCEAVVPGADESAFLASAEAAKRDCPVSRALAGVDIVLSAKLVQ